MISSNALAVGSDEVCAEIVLLSFCSFTDISCDCVPSVFVKASSRVLLGMVVRSVFVRGRSMTVKSWRGACALPSLSVVFLRVYRARLMVFLDWTKDHAGPSSSSVIEFCVAAVLTRVSAVAACVESDVPGAMAACRLRLSLSSCRPFFSGVLADEVADSFSLDLEIGVFLNRGSMVVCLFPDASGRERSSRACRNISVISSFEAFPSRATRSDLISFAVL